MPEPVEERLPTVPCPGCLSVGTVVRFEQPVDLRVLGKWMRVTATMRRCEACGVDWESTADPDWRPEAFAARRAEDALARLWSRRSRGDGVQ